MDADLPAIDVAARHLLEPFLGRHIRWSVDRGSDRLLRGLPSGRRKAISRILYSNVGGVRFAPRGAGADHLLNRLIDLSPILASPVRLCFAA